MDLTLFLLILLSLSLFIRPSRAHFNQSTNPLGCQEELFEKLDNDCRILKVYNRFQLEQSSQEDRLELTRFCACKLSQLPWEEQFDGQPYMRQLSGTVDRLLNSEEFLDKYPPYLWSDIDILVEGISIKHSTRDYWLKRAKKQVPASQMLLDYTSNPCWLATNRFCKIIAQDKAHLYGYMENLQRISPILFFNLLEQNPYINWTYQASKICKLLLVENLEMFELKPENQDIISAGEQNELTEQEQATYMNNIDNDVDDIDSALRYASVKLMNCSHWQDTKFTLERLNDECPMFASKVLPYQLFKSMSPYERTKRALLCSCQLLLHKDKWAQVMEDKNVALMSKALTNHMNQVKFPNVDKVPIWAFHGWFENTLKQFEEKRNLSIKMIIKFKHGTQDPKKAINKATKDEYDALELLRRGCNMIMFNRNKGSKDTGEIKLIRYLDNLDYISMDPQFVFHLTLQDQNLFKIYALSKICKPITK